MLSCGLLDVMDLVWWQPYHTPLEKDGPPRQTTAWLPRAIEVIADPEKSEVGPNVQRNSSSLPIRTPYMVTQILLFALVGLVDNHCTGVRHRCGWLLYLVVAAGGCARGGLCAGSGTFRG